MQKVNSQIDVSEQTRGVCVVQKYFLVNERIYIYRTFKYKIQETEGIKQILQKYKW